MLAALVVIAMAAGAGSDQVLTLVEQAKYSEALRAGKQAVEAEPGSARAHFAYGLALHSAYRRAEAAVELERALELAPNDVDIQIELGTLLAETGKLERARALAAVAAKRSPERAAELRDWLDREQRIRAGAKTPPARGSASGFVSQVMDGLARGEVEQFLRRDMDRAVIDRWARDAFGAPEGANEEVISGMAEGMRKAASARGAGVSLLGYQVGTESAGQGGRTVVSVEILIAARATRQQIAVLEKAADDPSLLPVDHDVARVLRGLEAADRRATLAAIAAHPAVSDVTLEFEVTQAGSGWKVSDVRETASGLRLSQLAGMTRDLADRGVIDLPKRRDRAYEIGEAVGRLLGVLLVAWLGIWLWRRSRRRRES